MSKWRYLCCILELNVVPLGVHACAALCWALAECFGHNWVEASSQYQLKGTVTFWLLLICRHAGAARLT